MYEILISQAYSQDELTELLNQHMGEKVDGVIMCWKDTTSLFIENLHDLTIEDAMQQIQSHLGDEVELTLDPED